MIGFFTPFSMVPVVCAFFFSISSWLVPFFFLLFIIFAIPGAPGLFSLSPPFPHTPSLRVCFYLVSPDSLTHRLYGPPLFRGGFCFPPPRHVDHADNPLRPPSPHLQVLFPCARGCVVFLFPPPPLFSNPLSFIPLLHTS